MAKATKKNQSTKKSVSVASKNVEKQTVSVTADTQEEAGATIASIESALDALHTAPTEALSAPEVGVPVEDAESASEAVSVSLEEKEEPEAEATVDGTEKEDKSVTETPVSENPIKEATTDEAVVKKVLLGFDVSEVGTEYPSTRNRHVVVVRQMIRKLEYLTNRMSADSLRAVAENLQAGINILERRVQNQLKGK